MLLHCHHLLFLPLVMLVPLFSNRGDAVSDGSSCNIFQGRWVLDETSSYPLYNESSCPFIQREFSCKKNGRHDQSYTNYRWQPLHCNLARFEGEDFLEKMRGKSIMFVGDSLSLNQWQSLTCMLHSAVPSSSYNISRIGDVSTFTLTDYEIKVMLDRSVYLVDVVKESKGRVLKLDSIQGGKLWTGNDMLIFNTWHWWNRRGPTQPWDYIEYQGKTMKDMDRMLAFQIALTTWGKWVDTNVDPSKVKVFFQGISPSHYNGTLWGEPEEKSCKADKTPLSSSTYPGGLPPEVGVLKSVLSKIEKPVQLLDITLLSLLRIDAHPSVYGFGGPTAMDCSHWCLPGVPDTWNEILYNLIL